MTKLLNQVFNKRRKRLPTITEWARHVNFDVWESPYINWNKTTETFMLRSQYIKYCFPILSHEFMSSFSEFCGEFNKIIEVGCGTGWMTYWLRQYGVETKAAIDDGKWQFKKQLDFVIRKNAITYLKQSININLIIMSWPNYDSNFALNIWDNLIEGQTLLYIGEGHGGSTANDDFHIKIEGHEIKDKWDLNRNFRSFWGIHDRIIILRK